MNDAKYWIQSLKLQPHPEGGWYREVYRAGESIARSALPDRFCGDRSFATSIYFLLGPDEFSALHRIKQDEMWHFYNGGTLTLSIISPTGELSTIRLGRNISAGETLFAVVPAGSLFGAAVNDAADPNAFSLVGCSTAPGFDFDDFEMPRREQILNEHPHLTYIITQLTRD